MPSPTLSTVPETYAELRRAVQGAMIHGQQVVEQAKLRTYHETGHLLDRHLTHHAGEAGYGTATMRRLAGDLQLEERIIYRCLQFARAYPKLSARTKLTWAYYRLLMQVPDKAQRTALERETTARDWTSAQLEERIRGLMAASGPTVDPLRAPEQVARLLTPKSGTPGVCKVIAAGDTLVVDLGFATYFDLPADTGLTAGNFVRLDAAGRATVAEGATKADLFTYTAAVLKVVDGDTLWVKIYLRARQWVKQKLRLRDLDAPELATAEGRSAKRFVETLLAKSSPQIVICTTKPDKYDRYLADVFLQVPSEKGQVTNGGEVFLNNALLAAGHAFIKREWEFKDWEPEL